MPVEIDLLNIYANGLERVLEANLTNLFGTSNDDFSSFKREKELAAHSSVTGDTTRLCKGEGLISPHGSPSVLLIELLNNIRLISEDLIVSYNSSRTILAFIFPLDQDTCDVANCRLLL